jgi:hypothetical protein
MLPEVHLPSSRQFLQVRGGAEGHSEALWPVSSHSRQVPVNSRATASFVQSALLWLQGNISLINLDEVGGILPRFTTIVTEPAVFNSLLGLWAFIFYVA